MLALAVCEAYVFQAGQSSGEVEVTPPQIRGQSVSNRLYSVIRVCLLHQSECVSLCVCGQISRGPVRAVVSS